MHAPIEFRTTWRKSSFTGGNECVEVAFGDVAVGVRDSKNVTGPVLAVTHDSWACLLDAVR